MRLKPGRPDLRAYDDRFSVPAASPDSPVAVTFMGVSSLVISDGSTSLITDGFFTRPGLLRTVTRPLAPDADRIRAGLRRAGVEQAAAVMPVHTHYDHALDSAAVATETGAVLVGGRSTANLGVGQHLPADRIDQVDGATKTFGGFTVDHRESSHCPPDRFPGEVTEPVRLPARTRAFRCGEAWSILISHEGSGRSVLVQGSAGFVPGALDGWSADVVYLGVGQLGLRPRQEIRDYWQHVVRAVGARRVVLIHWDDFFGPAEQPLRALPYAGDDLDVTMSVLGELAASDGVDLTLPQVWVREDPWVGL